MGKRGEVGILCLILLCMGTITLILTVIALNFAKQRAEKNMENTILDVADPQIISEEIISQNKNTYQLLNIDGYYIGRGFIDGEAYYIFQCQDDKTDSGYNTVAVKDSKLVINNGGVGMVEVIEKNLNQTIKSRVDDDIDNEQIIQRKYTFFIPENKVRDYGVIKEAKIVYTGHSWFPMFLPMFLR